MLSEGWTFRSRRRVAAAAFIVAGATIAGAGVALPTAGAQTAPTPTGCDTTTIDPLTGGSVSIPCDTTTTTPPPSDTEPTTTTAAPTTTQPPTTTTTVPVFPTGQPPLVGGTEPVAPLPRALTAARQGQSGLNVALMQFRLQQLGFWVGKVDGRYGPGTSQSVLAFQKYVGLPRNGANADQRTVNALMAQSVRTVGKTRSGTIVEVDKKRQLLFFIQNGSVLWLFNTSTGTNIPYVEKSQLTPGQLIRGDARTYAGRFRVYREEPKGWFKGYLGELYRPKFFNGGIAIHGSNNVPAYPASHGCVRVTTSAMDFIWANNLLPKGTPVWVYEA